MINIIPILLLLSFTLTGCAAAVIPIFGIGPIDQKPATASPKSDKLSDLTRDKELYENQKKQLEGELGLWKKDLCNAAVVSAGKSPIGGFTHLTPGQDPTIVSGWRDPMTKGDAEDRFIEAKSNIERIEDTLEMTKKALIKVNREIQELERIEAGGSEGGGGGGGGGGY